MYIIYCDLFNRNEGNTVECLLSVNDATTATNIIDQLNDIATQTPLQTELDRMLKQFQQKLNMNSEQRFNVKIILQKLLKRINSNQYTTISFDAQEVDSWDV